MNHYIHNKSNSIIYFDSESNSILENIWELITLDTLSKSDFNNHVLNSERYIQSPDFYKPVLKNIYPIPPKSKWVFDGESFNCVQSLEAIETRIDIFDLITRLTRKLNFHKIAVELSGGLDSSIIISMLLENGIDPFLIGFTCDRYEFRTERHIQNLYYNKVSQAILINSSAILPFQNLINCPFHPLPNPTSLYYYSKEVISTFCQKHNVDILLNGMSGDALFCESVKGKYLPSTWYNWMMDNRWFHENVFFKSNIHYLPVYSRGLANLIFKERYNSGFDSQKNWARHYFKKYLPTELVNYNYKADHVGDLVEGIKKSYYEVKELFRTTKELTKNSEFSEISLSKLYSGIEKYNDNQIKEIMSKVSYAVWIFSCIRNLDK